MKRLILRNKGLFVGVVFFSVVVSLLSVAVSLLIQSIVDTANAGDQDGFWNMGKATAVFLLASGIMMFVQNYLSKVFATRVAGRMRSRIFAGAIKLSPQDFKGVNTADYISALTNDVRIMEDNYIMPILEVVQAAVIFLATLALLLYMSPAITLALVFCLLIMFVAPALFGRAMQSRQERYSHHLAGFTGKAKDILGGYDIVRSYRADAWAGSDYERHNQVLTKSKLDLEKIIATTTTLSSISAAMTQLVVIFLAALFVMNGTITIGVLMALTILSGTFVSPIMTILQGFPKIKSTRPIIERLDSLADYQASSFTGTKPPRFEKEITTNSLTFSYGETKVLKGIDIRFQKGKKYAITGPSGCGKTTLIRLLTANYSDYGGTICLDGEELRTFDVGKLIALFAVIHQNIYLFDLSIKDNIALGGNFTPEQWEYALDTSGVTGFLDALPAGIDTPVGENGGNLSGGQRQRIAVARAILHDASVLVLDEGTSAVDKKTAYDIEGRLLSVPELTVITVTHNLDRELLGRYDAVLFMKDGKVCGFDKYDALMQDNADFVDFQIQGTAP